MSLEGTVAGIAAAAGIAGTALALGQVGWHGAACVVAAAVAANLLESVVGAVAQSKVDWLTNDVVNVLQISIAAALGMALVSVTGGFS